MMSYQQYSVEKGSVMKIFVTGANGYIGNAVSKKLLRLGHDVIGLARTKANADKIAADGITPLLGSLDDVGLLTDVATQSDAVIGTADADHPVSIRALIDGVEGRRATFIHTSGTGIYADAAAGEPSEKINEETDMPDLTEHKIGRWKSEQAVLKAAEGDTRTIVIRPSMIYGLGTSQQLPLLIDISKTTGAGRYIGRGLNCWSNVHIDDTVDFYLLALEKARAREVFNLASGVDSIKDIAEAISRMLGFCGATRPMTLYEGISFRGSDFLWIDLASNSRVSGKKARRLGWAPSRPTLLHDIEFGSYPDVWAKRCKNYQQEN